MSELDTFGDDDSAAQLDLVTAALRADTTDVKTFARVLGASLADALPEGMVDVERRRTLGDRLAGRDGAAVAVVVRTPERTLTLRESEHGSVEAEIATSVRGVVISRRPVGTDEWAAALAQELTALAERNAAARDALRRMLGA